jgi:UDP-N-acetylglucosamine acyltransferase
MTKIHSSAIIQKSAQVDDSVRVGPNCVIENGASIGAGTVLDANVVIRHGVKVGKDNHFFPNCVIGCTPQTLGLSDDSKIGGLVVGNRNTFHENVTIHPSIYEDGLTIIGNDNFFMVGVHIGHDCIVEDKTVISNFAQFSGHCKIEAGAWLSGLVALHQFVTLGKWCYVTGIAGITRDVPPFLTVSGHHPFRVRGVNKRGLIRAGLSTKQQDHVCEAYKKLYRRGGALLENAKALEKQDNLDENVRAIIDAIKKSSQHRYGRYRELFRRR